MKIFSFTFFMKFLRVLIFIFSLFGLLFYVREIYVKWNFNPDLMTTQKVIPSYKVSMPALTICPPMIFAKRKIEKEFSALFWHVCNFDKAAEIFNNDPQLNFENPVKLLDEFSPTIGEIFSSCSFRGQRVKCDKIVTRVLTDFGFCFATNELDMSEIFNVEVIGDDFKSYEKKLRENSEIR